MNDPRLLWQIMSAGRRIEERLESALDDTGLSLAKLNALKYLVEAEGPLALGQLAEKIECVKSNVTQLVDRLENEGLVRRMPDPNDRRGVLAGVTELGLERYSAGARALADAEAELISELPENQRSLLIDLLSHVTGGSAHHG
jgi:DNA-binding MarR family transcriptional regulator